MVGICLQNRGICDMKSETEIVCKVPEASDSVKRQVNTSRRRRKRETCSNCMQTTEVYVKLDGVEHSFRLSYYQDPTINKFDNQVKLYPKETHELIISVSIFFS